MVWQGIAYFVDGCLAIESPCPAAVSNHNLRGGQEDECEFDGGDDDDDDDDDDDADDNNACTDNIHPSQPPPLYLHPLHSFQRKPVLLQQPHQI